VTSGRSGEKALRVGLCADCVRQNTAQDTTGSEVETTVYLIGAVLHWRGAVSVSLPDVSGRAFSIDAHRAPALFA
jgi:hypothetical protein